jgi:hypothetical protein
LRGFALCALLSFLYGDVVDLRDEPWVLASRAPLHWSIPLQASIEGYAKSREKDEAKDILSEAAALLDQEEQEEVRSVMKRLV